MSFLKSPFYHNPLSWKEFTKSEVYNSDFTAPAPEPFWTISSPASSQTTKDLSQSDSFCCQMLCFNCICQVARLKLKLKPGLNTKGLTHKKIRFCSFCIELCELRLLPGCGAVSGWSVRRRTLVRRTMGSTVPYRLCQHSKGLHTHTHRCTKQAHKHIYVIVRTETCHTII